MSIERIIKRIEEIAIEDSGWIKDAKFRQENEAWLDVSFGIALAILSALRAEGKSQKDLADALECSPQYVNKIVKGSENMTLETICKIEKALNIKLITGPYSQNSTEPNLSSQQAQQ